MTHTIDNPANNIGTHDTSPGNSGENQEKTTTDVVFLTDDDTSSFLLSDTIADLIRRKNISHALVDPSHVAGQIIIQALVDSNVAFSLVDVGVASEHDPAPSLPETLRDQARDTIALDIAGISTSNALVVIAPSIVEGVSPRLNLAPDNLCGVAIEQLQSSDKGCLLLMPPEMGVRMKPNSPGDYLRLVLDIAH